MLDRRRGCRRTPRSSPRWSRCGRRPGRCGAPRWRSGSDPCRSTRRAWDRAAPPTSRPMRPSRSRSRSSTGAGRMSIVIGAQVVGRPQRQQLACAGRRRAPRGRRRRAACGSRRAPRASSADRRAGRRGSTTTLPMVLGCPGLSTLPSAVTTSRTSSRLSVAMKVWPAMPRPKAASLRFIHAPGLDGVVAGRAQVADVVLERIGLRCSGRSRTPPPTASARGHRHHPPRVLEREHPRQRAADHRRAPAHARARHQAQHQRRQERVASPPSTRSCRARR